MAAHNLSLRLPLQRCLLTQHKKEKKRISRKAPLLPELARATVLLYWNRHKERERPPAYKRGGDRLSCFRGNPVDRLRVISYPLPHATHSRTPLPPQICQHLVQNRQKQGYPRHSDDLTVEAGLWAIALPWTLNEPAALMLTVTNDRNQTTVLCPWALTEAQA